MRGFFLRNLCSIYYRPAIFFFSKARSGPVRKPKNKKKPVRSEKLKLKKNANLA